MNSLEQRVAWAWLDKALGRSPVSLSPQVVPTTPRGRALVLEKTYEGLLAILTQAIAAEISGLRNAERSIAQQRGIDPVFLNWLLINGKHWPSMPEKMRRSLRTVQSIFLWHGAMPSHWNDMNIPDIEEDDDRDVALQDLAIYFAQVALPRIERKFAKAIWEASRTLHKEMFGESESHLSLLLANDFKRRLIADRFEKKPAVQQVADFLL